MVSMTFTVYTSVTIVRNLHVLIVFKAELSHHDLDVGLGWRLQELLEPDQASVVLVQDGEALPAKTGYEVREGLARQ